MKKNINKEQQEAIDHFEGPLLVIAGAGSGKTFVVTRRIEKLIKNGVLPSDILAVTFTNKAAEEMKKRIKAQTDKNVLTCTFHSLGAKILRESIDHLGFSNNFNIYDEEDSVKLIKECLKTLNLKDEKGLSKKLKRTFSTVKNNLTDINDESLLDEKSIEKEIFILYQTRLKEANSLDFDDLLYLTVKLLKENSQIKEKYQNRWSFLLIDEYQDTNIAQYTLAKILSAKHKNIFAVGDPDQAIYSWRGAQHKNILQFDSDYPNAQIIKLEHNYRSTSTILSAANELIKHNTTRYEKNLWSQMGEGKKIGTYLASNDKEEASFIIDTILHHHKKEKIPLNEIAIFYRTNFQSRVFEDILLSNDLPYIIYGGISFYQRKEIKDIISFLKMIISDSDYISFSRTINIPKRGIGSATITKLINLAQQKQTPILNICYDVISSKYPLRITGKQKQSLEEYLLLIKELRRLANSHVDISEIVKETTKLIRYEDVLKLDPDTYEDKKNNVEEFIAKTDESKHDSLVKFLEELSLLTSHETSHEESIKLMTIHNAKGLEFSLAFIAGLEEDLFPHINSKTSIEALEEERRLCYVGMTRAKQLLYMTAAFYRFLWGSPKIMTISRFFNDIPHKFLLNLSKTEYFPESDLSEEEVTTKFRAGSKVAHKTFGKGMIQKIYNTSLGETYDVLFEEDNLTRSLVAKYAKLSTAS
jgi:DNA helicase II / ATP-dependent DNA helicase PcrA